MSLVTRVLHLYKPLFRLLTWLNRWHEANEGLLMAESRPSDQRLIYPLVASLKTKFRHSQSLPNHQVLPSLALQGLVNYPELIIDHCQTSDRSHG